MNEVADRVYRLGTRWANFYLVTEGNEGFLVDAGYPGYFEQLRGAAQELGIGVEGIRAVIVTHHHVDHAGTAEEVRSHAGARVLVGAEDAEIVRGERPSHPPQGFWRSAWRPSMLAYLLHTVRVGGASYRPVTTVEMLDQGERLDLPGGPRIVPTPGHTAGHCAVWLEDRGVLLCGDAMVNFDYATGRRGLKLHRFNDHREGAMASLDRLEGIDADIVLCGHGDPWSEGVGRAVEIVRERG